MEKSGIIRRIDELGRIVIPKEIRRVLGIRDGESLEIFIEDKNIILKKYNRLIESNSLATNLCELVASNLNYRMLITDRDKFLTGFINEDIPSSLIEIMENREIVIKENYTLKDITANFVFVPIISLNDYLGLVIIYNTNKLTNEISIAKLIASIISKKLDI